MALASPDINSIENLLSINKRNLIAKAIYIQAKKISY